MNNNNLDDKIKELSDMLNDPETKDSLKGLLQSFFPQNTITRQLSSSNANYNNSNSEDDLPENIDINDNYPDKPIENHNQSSPLPSSLNNNLLNDFNLQSGIEMLSKAQNLMQNINNSSNSRVELLNAIRPFLSTRRQQHFGTCVNLLKLTGVAKSIGGFIRK